MSHFPNREVVQLDDNGVNPFTRAGQIYGLFEEPFPRFKHAESWLVIADELKAALQEERESTGLDDLLGNLLDRAIAHINWDGMAASMWLELGEYASGFELLPCFPDRDNIHAGVYEGSLAAFCRENGLILTPSYVHAGWLESDGAVYDYRWIFPED